MLNFNVILRENYRNNISIVLNLNNYAKIDIHQKTHRNLFIWDIINNSNSLVFFCWNILNLVLCFNFICSPYANFIHAMSIGATSAVEIIAGILSNLIAFLAALRFLNITIAWFGQRLCIQTTLSFEVLIAEYCIYFWDILSLFWYP